MAMVLQAIILGIVQGLTEFLPISSSAHLYLMPRLLGWTYEGLGFDVALHWGTLLAILIIFWRDYFRALTSDRRLLWFLILGSIPGAAAGYFLESQAETVFRTPLLTAAMLAGFALALWWADGNSSQPPLWKRGGDTPSLLQREGGGELGWKKSLFIGAAQALAIIPGVSRSGATMTAGLFSGLSRKEAARFSFLLSGPIIFGAGLVAIPEACFDTALVVGFAAAALSGFLTIKFLLRYLTAHNFTLFVWYRLALAAIILLMIWQQAF